MLLLDITIVNVALPDIQHALHSTFSDLQWIVDAYALTLAAFLLTGGSLADMYGRRLLYLVGLVIFTASSVLCGFSVSTLMLVLCRALQGIGGAVMFAVSLALLADAFRGRDRGTAFGIWGAITGLAVAIGPLLGGILTSGISWRWIFFVNAPIGLAALVITIMRVSESRQPKASRPDWAGFVLFTAALACLVYALIESSQKSFTDSVVLGCFAASALLLIAFVLVEWRIASPMFDLNLFRLPTFSGGLVAALGISASIFSVLLYLVLYLQDILGYSALGDRRAADGHLRRDPHNGHYRRPDLLPGAGPPADRAGAGADRRRPAADARPRRDVPVDPPDPRHDCQRTGGRHGQPAARLDRRRRRAAAARRDGLRDQLDVPPGRHRHRHRPPRLAVRQQDRGRRESQRGGRARAVRQGRADRCRRPVGPGQEIHLRPAAARPAIG